MDNFLKIIIAMEKYFQKKGKLRPGKKSIFGQSWDSLVPSKAYIFKGMFIKVPFYTKIKVC